jgi:hypothetical protein
VLILGDPRRVRPGHESGDEPGAADAPSPIGGECEVVVVVSGCIAAGVPGHEDRADVRAPPEVLADASDGEVVAEILGGVISLHVEQSDVGWPRAAGESRAGQNRNLLSVLADSNASAEKHFRLARTADREEPGIFQEERPLLREEEIEAVQIHLLLVDLDLCEVGVDGRVQGQARRHAVLGVKADVPEELRVAVRRAALPRLAKRVRYEREVPLDGEIEADQNARKRHAHQVELNRKRRPERRLLPSPDRPLKIHAPFAVFARLVSQCLERNLELRRPTGFRGCRSDFPRAVPIQIESAAGPANLSSAGAAASATTTERVVVAFPVHLAVVFECCGRRREDEPVLAVPICIQHDAKAVGVLERRVTARVGRRHPGRISIE